MNTTFCQDIYQMLCKKYPNRKIYVIGDQHFFHNNIINYTRANFSNVLEMNQYIIKMHNETIDKDDIVIFLGDFCFKKEFTRNILGQMNGHKYLILGNHDPLDLVKYYPSLGFEGVYTTPIKIGDNYLSHEPLSEGEREDLQFQIILNEFKKCAMATNYHGHIHTDSGIIMPGYRNVTCEALGYKPIIIGETMALCEHEEKPLFINSSYLDEVINMISHKHSVDPNFLLNDYLYTYVLAVLTNYQSQYFVQGSVGLLKKYSFLAKTSDMDISFIYDSLSSNKKNIANLKQMIDVVYESLKHIDGIDLAFLKRYSNMRILKMLYTSNGLHFSQSIIDTNLIFLDCYKDTDFVTLNGTSIIQKFLPKDFQSMLSEYSFPTFQSRFISPEGDIANLLLQIFFQEGRKEKKLLALKKLRYVYNCVLKNRYIENFSDLFIRLFLRNVAFLYTMNRFDEIEDIKVFSNDIYSLISNLPINLQIQINDILNNPNSTFNLIYNEITSVPVADSFEKVETLIRTLKK